MTQPAMTGPLIPRTKLFGNPTRAQGQISPDGRWLSWLAPKDGVLNIWLAPAGDIGAARAITNDKKRGIRFHGWAYDGTHVLYMQDEGGTEDLHIYAVAIEGGQARDLTPLPGVQARIQELSLDEPDVMADRHQRPRQGLARSLSHRHRAPASASFCSRTRASWPSIVLDRQLRAAGWPPSRATRRAATSSTALSAASSSRSW